MLSTICLVIVVFGAFAPWMDGYPINGENGIVADDWYEMRAYHKNPFNSFDLAGSFRKRNNPFNPFDLVGTD